jgi:alpha-L-rhamnosidase
MYPNPTKNLLVKTLVCAALLLAVTGLAVAAAPAQRLMPWDLATLSQAPVVHATTERPAKGMRAFFYEGADYHGKPTWVFAYYAAPEGTPPDGGWPAVVCAHGGGGSAYPDWVRAWTKRGYAAIAMDLEGHLPGGKHHGVEGNFPPDATHDNAGPKRLDWFGDRDLPDKEQWFYHGVADVIRAHSLLRSFPEINPDKIGLTGISWGGTLVSAVAGVDSRFAFVIPVYGCGFIHESDNPGLSQWFPPKHMTAEQYRDYRSKWDPSAHLPYAKMPMLWVSGFNDGFNIDILSKSARIAGGPSRLCVRNFLIHGHGDGWEEALEIYAFADSIVKGGVPLLSLAPPQVDPVDGLVHAKTTGDVKNATLSYTTSSGLWKDRRWDQLPCRVSNDEIIASKPLPAATTSCIITAYDPRDCLVNSDLVEINPSGVVTKDLRCEYLVNPLGIDVAKPRLAWVMENPKSQIPNPKSEISGGQGTGNGGQENPKLEIPRVERQAAYQVLVATTPELLAKDRGDLWDSGKVVSDQSNQIEYAGKQLESRLDCHWKVRVWLGTGEASHWSKPAVWSMGLLMPGDWQAKWIGFDSDEGLNDWKAMSKLPWDQQRTRLPARMLRHEFRIAKPVKRATLYVCGQGFHDVYLNGRQVGDHLMDPALSGPNERVFYVAHDVTQQLGQGANALGAVLGNGRFFPLRGQVHYNFGFPKLLLQMMVEYADGTSEVVTSDTNWKLTTSGPLRANNEYDGEEYDARMAMAGWASAGFDAAAWQAAQQVEAPKGKLQAQMIDPMRVVGRIRPVAITHPKEGVYIVDFGRVFYGNYRLTVSGPAGTKLGLRSACSLKPDGMLKTEANRQALCTDTYIMSGQGTETWSPRFKGQGFRRIEVTGFPGVPTLDNFEGLAINTDLEAAGSFTCSNPLVNRIFDNVRRTQQIYKRSAPLDPDRDERQGWLGDPAKDAESDAWNFRVAPFYAKWLDDIRLQQTTQGAFLLNAPIYFKGGDYTADLVWESCSTIIADSFYQIYGDRRIIENNYAPCAKWMELINRQMKPDGTIDRNEFGDWCDALTMDRKDEIPDADGKLRRYEFGATSGPLISTAYHYNNCRIMERMAGILGKTTDQQQYADLAAKVKTGFNNRFFDPKTGKYWSGTQCAYVLPLAFGMVPDEQREKVIANLVDDIMVKHKGHLSVGLIGMQWLMQTLTNIGHPEVAYTIVTQTTRPSWGYMISKDATTVWEKWDMDTQGPEMNCEALLILSGNLNAWFYQTLAGINYDPAQPGFKHIRIKPAMVGDLTWVNAHHDSPFGRVASAWQRDGNQLTMEVTIPVNTTATVYVPAKAAAAVSESGQPASQATGVKFLRMEGAAAVFHVGSGIYQFKSAIEK